MRTLPLVLLLAACSSEPPPAAEEPEPTPTLSLYEQREQCKLSDYMSRSIYQSYITLADKHGHDAAREIVPQGYRITPECLDLIVVNAMYDNPEWTPTP